MKNLAEIVDSLLEKMEKSGLSVDNMDEVADELKERTKLMLREAENE